jgi:carboxylesterase type B
MKLVWSQSQSGHFEEEKNIITAKDGTIIPWQSSYSSVTATNTQNQPSLDCLILKIEAPHSFKTSPFTRRYGITSHMT